MAVYGEAPKWAPIPLPDPYQSGYAAGLSGSLAARCPYPAGSVERGQYYNGYARGETVRRFGR